MSDQTPTRVLESLLDAPSDDSTIVEHWDEDTPPGQYLRASHGKYRLSARVPIASADASEDPTNPLTSPPSSAQATISTQPMTSSAAPPEPPTSVAPVAMPASATGPHDAMPQIERFALPLCGALVATAALLAVLAATIWTRTNARDAERCSATVEAERAAAAPPPTGD